MALEAEDIQKVAYQNYTGVMAMQHQGGEFSSRLLDRSSIKKFDEIQADEAKSTQAVLASPPQYGPQGS